MSPLRRRNPPEVFQPRRSGPRRAPPAFHWVQAARFQIHALVVGLVVAFSQGVEAFTYHWELDETPQGSDRVTQVRPVRVLLSDQLLEIAPHSASLQLMKKYSVHLGEEWSSGHAYSLLRTFESIPQEANDPYDEQPQVPPSIWRLTHEHVQDDISVDVQDGQRMVTIAQEAFVHSEPLMAEIEGVRGRFFSKRLHEAVVRFVTDGGRDREALKRILQERYGVSIDVPDYTELTRNTTGGEPPGRFSEFKNEELLFLASMFEEYPEGMRLTPGLRYLVRRLDGTPHPLYPEAPAVAWPTEGYIEFMESAFKGQGPAYIHRLILHEKAHFLWEHLFDDQLKQDWIELGGWYENPEDEDGWSTTQQLEFVSAYAHGINPNEDMAESISYYIVTPDKLRSRSPAKYEFIQNRIMHGVRYISQIRKDLTFQVYNLYPDLVYPGRIIRVDIQVDGEPEEDKRITVELEIHRSGDDQDGAHGSNLRIFSPKGTYFDLWLNPNESGHILRGHTTLSKHVAHGYWAPDQITLSDAHGNERHESQTDFGWKLYIDNPLADNEPPVYVKDSARLTLSGEATENGRRYQVVTASWEFFDETRVVSVGANLNDGELETYSRHATEHGGGIEILENKASAHLPIPDYFPSGTYYLNNISMKDVANNWQNVYFTDRPLDLSKVSMHSDRVMIDEAPQTIEIQTAFPDIVPPEVDVNRITVDAEPTRPEDPNGETVVDITFRVRDNISGYHRSSLYLRDPNGVEHYFAYLHQDFYNIYHQGDPTAWEIQKKTITLPVGSLPGLWGLAYMTVEDKAQNILRLDFTEIIRFEVNDGDSPVTAVAIPQALRKVSGDEQAGTAGEPLPDPFVVSVLDQNKGAYPGAPVTFEITGGQGSLSAETALTDSAGQAATFLTLGKNPGTNTVDVLVAGLLPVTFTARGMGIPHTLTKVSGLDQEELAGSLLPQPFVVRVADQHGNFLADVSVTFAVAAGNGTLSAETATTDADGLGSTTLTLGRDPGRNTVTARVGDIKPVIFSATGLAIPTTLAVISGGDQQAGAGAALPEPFVVAVKDQNDNPLEGAQVTFAVTAGEGTLSVTTASTDENGRATTTLTLGNVLGSVTAVATVAGLDPVTFTAKAETASPDFDGDGETGFSDFFQFADAFGGSDPRFDLDGNGSVDFGDFFLLADHFTDPDARGKLLALARQRIGLPDGPLLQQNAPNPFNSQTVITWFQLRPGPVRVDVFSLTGQRVSVVHQKLTSKAGLHRVSWEGQNEQGAPVASGVYLYRLVTPGGVQTRKLTVLR